MANGTPQDLSGAGIRAAASETVRQGTDIRAKVHELTLLALQTRSASTATACARWSARSPRARRSAPRRAAPTCARRCPRRCSGLDQALRTSAEAGHMALKTARRDREDVLGQRVQEALANLRKLEDDFLATVGQVADAASEQVQPELREALRTARQSGTADRQAGRAHDGRLRAEILGRLARRGDRRDRGGRRVRRARSPRSRAASSAGWPTRCARPRRRRRTSPTRPG